MCAPSVWEFRGHNFHRLRISGSFSESGIHRTHSAGKGGSAGARMGWGSLGVMPRRGGLCVCAALMSVLASSPDLLALTVTSRNIGNRLLTCVAKHCSSTLQELVIEGHFSNENITVDAIRTVLRRCRVLHTCRLLSLTPGIEIVLFACRRRCNTSSVTAVTA